VNQRNRGRTITEIAGLSGQNAISNINAMIAGISENDRSQTMADGRAREVTGHLGFSLVCSRPFGKSGDRSIVSYLVRPMPFMSPSGNAWRCWIGPDAFFYRNHGAYLHGTDLGEEQASG
jgi:hypothetical protein